LRAGCAHVPLKEVAAINPRLTEPPRADEAVSFVPMAELLAAEARTTAGELRRFSELSNGYSQFRRDDVLVAKITPCFENGKIGRATIGTAIGAGSTEFHVIRPDPRRLDTSYALHFIRRSDVRQRGILRMTGSAGQRRVPASFLEALKIPLPPLDEQQRIAQVLNAASQVRAKRISSIELLDALRDAVFLTMMLPAPTSWPLIPVSDLIDGSRGGIRTGPFGSQLLHSEFVDAGVAVLGIDNAVTNEFRRSAQRYISDAKYQQLRRYTVNPRDVLITIMGTCGRAAVVPDDIGLAINTKHLCCISLDESKCLPSFLHAYFLRHPLSQRYLLLRARGAIMAGLNMRIIKDLPVLLPPIEIQARLEAQFAGIDRMREKMIMHNRQLEALFDCLEHRAFSGEL